MSQTESQAKELVEVIRLALSNHPNVAITSHTTTPNIHVMEDGTQVDYLVSMVTISGSPFIILFTIDYLRQTDIPQTKATHFNMMLQSISTKVISSESSEDGVVSWLNHKDQNNTLDIGLLIKENTNLNDRVVSMQNQINEIKEQYAGLQSYIREYVNIEKMKEVVYKIGMAVDEEILHEFRLIKVH